MVFGKRQNLYSGVLFLVELQAAVEEEEEEDTFSLSTHFLPDNSLLGIFLPIYLLKMIFITKYFGFELLLQKCNWRKLQITRTICTEKF